MEARAPETLSLKLKSLGGIQYVEMPPSFLNSVAADVSNM
jgi:hypothetical protein